MLRAVQNVVILKVPEKPDKTEGGIFLPQANNNKTCEGTVFAAGPGLQTKKGVRLPMTVKEGDTVLFEHGRGIRIKYNDTSFVVLREPDICMVMDGLQGNEYDPSSYYEQKEIVYQGA